MQQTELSALIVENDPAFTEYLQHAVNGLFGRVEYAKTFAEAITRVRGKDVIFLDLYLPDMQGIQTLETMRTITTSTPIIAITDIDDATFALKLLRSGARDYILKNRANGIDVQKMVDSVVMSVRSVEKFRRGVQKLDGVQLALAKLAG